MARLPYNETGAVALCHEMIAGYAAHPGDFPSVTMDVLSDLQGALASYNQNKQTQEAAHNDAVVATANKDETFDNLRNAIRNTLKLSEIDCSNSPEKLEYIGWGTRDAMTAQSTVPVQPTYLKITAEGPADIWLSWEHPSRLSVRHWIIERRQQMAPGGDFTAWTLAGTSLNCQVHLAEQPAGVKLEYRVKGENNIGLSEPSNSVFAVL